MSVVVTLADFLPPAREDGIPWTKARIDEAGAQTGPWTTIDTVTLALPLDADPAYPLERDLTTSNATLTEGWYRVAWIDATGGISAASAPVQNVSELQAVRPSVNDIASLLRARTKIAGGGEAGTFNAKTRPTADEVEDLIDDAMDEVLGKVQPPLPGTDYERRVRGAIRLYAAILIETSFWPEQVKNNHSPVATYQALYTSRIKSLIAEGEAGHPQGEGAGGPGGGDSPADAAWAYPENTGGLVGWGSRW